MKKKVLLVCYGAGHSNIMAPVFNRLQADGFVHPVVLALSIAKNHFKSHNVPFRTLSDYKNLIMDADAEQYGELLADRWHVEASGLTRTESVIYLGASMRDLVKDVGEPEAYSKIERLGRQCFLPVETMSRVIDCENPDFIMTTNSPRMERASVLVGNERGIPTLSIHDDLGFMRRDYVLSADRIAVMSEITKENLLDQGHRAGRIVVTGHPAFDPVKEELHNFDRAEIIRKLNLPEAPRYLLLATSHVGVRGHVMNICPLVCEFVDRSEEFHLIIKPHPGEDADAYRHYAESRRRPPTVITGVNIRELLAVSELLMTFKSTTMIESVLMGKPVVSVNLTGGPDPFPYVQWGLGVEAKDEEGLKTATREALNNEGFRKRFEAARQRYFGSVLDGGATERVTSEIYDLLSTR